jgi:glucosyl-3-phosphoglycerate synthase
MIWNREFSEGDGGKISIVIPVLNESATITSVVQYALNSPLVDEVIVVDDGSIDGTPELAAAAGARVITSSMLGKGVSMEEGMRAAKNETILFLDGDLVGLDESVIESMVLPILRGEADFVKAKFSRSAGRVTVLTARPLIRTYFPELRHFDQPLSGIMAARKSLLEQLTFENDYGVDVGLLIDASLARARLAEVDIGSLEHRSQSLHALSEMATQVARALLERAARAGRLRLSYIRDSRESERIETLSLGGLLDRIPLGTKRIALFDMDGVLLNGRFVLSLAQETDRETDLAALLDNYAMSPLERMQQIAAVFAGVRKETFEKVAREVPLMPGVQETIVALKKAGYRVGIVTDSYNVAAETVRRRVFGDFTFSHVMRFKNGKASGKVIICPAMIHPDGCREHDHCKVNVLKHLMERCDLGSDSIVAVGDGENDICMLKEAGSSIAFQPKNKRVRNAAKFCAQRMSEVAWLAGAMQMRESFAEAESELNETLSN